MRMVDKWRLRKFLKGCDYKIAREILVKKFSGGVIPKKLALLLDRYVSNPCFETAVDLIRYNGDYLAVFELSKSEVMKRLSPLEKSDNG